MVRSLRLNLTTGLLLRKLTPLSLKLFQPNPQTPSLGVVWETLVDNRTNEWIQKCWRSPLVDRKLREEFWSLSSVKFTTFTLVTGSMSKNSFLQLKKPQALAELLRVLLHFHCTGTTSWPLYELLVSVITTLLFSIKSTQSLLRLHTLVEMFE